MFRLGIGMVLILLAQGVAVLCGAAEIDLPSIEANRKTYSNVTVSSTSRNRVVVRHAGGLITINAADLSDETRRQLIQAGMIEDPSVVAAAKKGKEKTGFFSGSLAKSRRHKMAARRTTRRKRRPKRASKTI